MLIVRDSERGCAGNVGDRRHAGALTSATQRTEALVPYIFGRRSGDLKEIFSPLLTGKTIKAIQRRFGHASRLFSHAYLRSIAGRTGAHPVPSRVTFVFPTLATSASHLIHHEFLTRATLTDLGRINADSFASLSTWPAGGNRPELGEGAECVHKTGSSFAQP